MKRRAAREKALQALFQIHMNEMDTELAIDNVVNEGKGDDFLERLVFGVLENIEQIDQLIKDNLEKWNFDRLANVDRIILRLAVYEMKYMQEIPLSVSIDEAIELAKVFGDERSGAFINAVLSKIQKELIQQ